MGEDARVWYGSDVPLYRKEEALKLLNIDASNRTERGAIRPYSGLNTPLFLPFENGKKS